MSLNEVCTRTTGHIGPCNGYPRHMSNGQVSGLAYFCTGQTIADLLRKKPDAPMTDGAPDLYAATRQKDDGSNPKDLLGVLKLPLRFIPAPALAYLSKVMELGATKYGPFNWRKTKVKRTVYLEAAIRHILSALDGEDLDPESDQPHEAHAMACMAIVLDADATGNLIDDRFTPGVFGELVQKMQAKKAEPQAAPAAPCSFPTDMWFQLRKPGRPAGLPDDALVSYRSKPKGRVECLREPARTYAFDSLDGEYLVVG